MIVDPVTAGLDTMTHGDTFIVGSDVFVVLGGSSAPVESGKVAVCRLHDGEVQMFNAGSVVTKVAFKAVQA